MAKIYWWIELSDSNLSEFRKRNRESFLRIQIPGFEVRWPQERYALTVLFHVCHGWEKSG